MQVITGICNNFNLESIESPDSTCYNKYKSFWSKTMGFIDSYKRIEKICREQGYANGFSGYIEEMKIISDGDRYVSEWYSDLKRIKHYRWLRNKIVHEPEYTEANTCDYTDTVWLDSFYRRLLNGTDPLSMYRRAKSHPISRPTYQSRPTYRSRPYVPSRSGGSLDGCATWLCISALFILGIILLI